MTRLILVRHGETEANVSQIWHGALDAPLTPQGEAQVAAVSARLAMLHAERPIDHFYVSPLSRARITAQAIADATGLEPEIEEGLQEMSIGDWEGRTFTHLSEVDRLWERWESDPSFAPPNGESPITFTTRVPQTFEKLIKEHAGETILVVSHGGVISNLLAQWLGEGPQDWRRWDPHNCSITILDQQGENWHVYCLNDIDHLEEIGYLDPEWISTTD
jgi:broad specificity phosphatase PhoE